MALEKRVVGVTPSRDDVEQSFKEDLESVLVVLQKLGEHCDSVGEIIDMVMLGLSNAGQLRLLMAVVASGEAK